MSATFFVDRDLGKRFPEVLAAANLSVERHHELFRHDCPDEEWLAHVGRNDWIAVTHDTRIRYKPNELAAVDRHGVALLVVIGRAPYPELARTFVATMPRIAAFVAARPRPFIAKIHRPSPSERSVNPDAPGSVTLWWSRTVSS